MAGDAGSRYAEYMRAGLPTAVCASTFRISLLANLLSRLKKYQVLPVEPPPMATTPVVFNASFGAVVVGLRRTGKYTAGPRTRERENPVSE